MRMKVLTKFNHNPASAHLVGDSTRGAGASEGIEYQVPWLCTQRQNAV